MARPDRRPARPPHLNAPASAQRGIALVLVLWALTLLTVMAVGMTAAQRTETALTENVIAEARFRALSEAAIAYTAFDFLNPPSGLADGGLGSGTDAAAAEPTAQWLPNGAPRVWAFAGTPLSIAVFNEQSRLNLNAAPRQVLATLIEVLGADPEDAGRISDAIEDWRDEDDLKLLNGAEDPDYEQAGRPLGAKDAPFVAVEELQQVLGVTLEVYRLLAAELTVDTENDQVDQTFASAAVLAALQGIGLAEAELQVQQRDQATGLDGQPQQMQNRGGPLYRIQVREQGTASIRTMEALIVLTPGQPQPYRVRWQRFGLLAAPPSAAPAANGG